jgi:putative CocE/NonD family hydrolase
MSDVQLQWGIRIPMRDGCMLSAVLYLPEGPAAATPCLFALTPYTVQRNHLRASYFAARGYPFLIVDVRGRGNSEGEFRPFLHEAQDGYDIVEWLAAQPYCNGQVAMFSGSYEGYAQWATAKEFPPHLAAIAPGMAAVPGGDFPMRNNIPISYVMQWLTYVTGRTLQENVFADLELWRRKFRQWFESGRPFRELDVSVGNPSSIFQEWLSHPQQDEYWDALQPAATEFAKIDLPILTLTGSYDAAQPGALHHYREHLRNASAAAAARHYLVIGPWDHSSVLAPKAEFVGLSFAPAAVMDTLRLQLEWYDWTLRGGPRPEFLRDRVAYYVMGAERWRYAESLEAVTTGSLVLYVHLGGESDDSLGAGALIASAPQRDGVDQYVYDPRDVSLAALESTMDPESRTDQRVVLAARGKQLVYHSEPFADRTEISGFFRFTAWFSIDQPDTDFRASVYDVAPDGSAVLLSSDWIRARYRTSLREARLVESTAPLRYDFNRFTFVSREIGTGHRLRLVVGPINSIYSQKNYNSGGVVSAESMRDARTVTVRMLHGPEHASVLHVPLGRADA